MKCKIVSNPRKRESKNHLLHNTQNEGDIILVFKIHASVRHIYNSSNLHHMNKVRFYPAKVLLFGEYTVLQGGLSVGLPIANFSSKWEKGTPNDAETLVAFQQFISAEFADLLDLEKWSADIQSGIFLKTTIPVRSGLGSSGNVVAAVYDRYAKSPEVTDLYALQTTLARMENFFHGTSSGFDPLIIYLQSPLIKRENQIEKWTEFTLHELYPWLLDSKSSRADSPIALFNERMSDLAFRSALEAGMELTNQLIEFTLHQKKEVWDALIVLSQWQFNHLDFLIPEKIKPIWEAGLQHRHYLIKLCGAGGGGLFQVWTEQPIWPEELSDWPHYLLRF